MSDVSTMIMDLGQSPDIKAALSSNQQESQQFGSEFSKMVEQHIIDEKGGKNKPLPPGNREQQMVENKEMETEAQESATSQVMDSNLDKHAGSVESDVSDDVMINQAQATTKIEESENTETSTKQLLALLDASDKALQPEKQTEVAKSVHQAIVESQQKSLLTEGDDKPLNENITQNEENITENEENSILAIVKQAETSQSTNTVEKAADVIAKEVARTGSENVEQVIDGEDEAQEELPQTVKQNSLINAIKANESNKPEQTLQPSESEAVTAQETISTPGVDRTQQVASESENIAKVPIKDQPSVVEPTKLDTSEQSVQQSNINKINNEAAENVAANANTAELNSNIKQPAVTVASDNTTKINQAGNQVSSQYQTNVVSAESEEINSDEPDSAVNTQANKEGQSNAFQQQKSETGLTDNKPQSGHAEHKTVNAAAVKISDTSSTIVQQSVTDTLIQNNVAEISRNAREVSPLQTETIAIYRKDFANAVKEKVMVMINQKLQRVDIQLDPPELGNVSVRVNLQGEQAAVNFVVQNQQAKDALEQNLGKLRDMLSESGVDVGDANVEQQQKNNQQEMANHSENVSYPESIDNELNAPESMIQHNLYKASATGIDYFA